MNCTGFKYILKRVGAEPTVCTSGLFVKKIYFMVQFSCGQNFRQKFEVKSFSSVFFFFNFNKIVPLV